MENNRIIFILAALLFIMLIIFIYIGKTKWYRFVSLRRIDRMDGVEFEKYLLHLFQSKGYKGHLTKASGDFGADLILYDGEDKIAVQAKRYDKPVGVAAVQQAIAGMGYYDCDYAMVVTNQSFTRQARQLAAKSNVELLDRQNIIEMMGRGNANPAAEEPELAEEDFIDITFMARVHHEDPALVSESVIYTILEEALLDHGYDVDGDI